MIGRTRRAGSRVLRVLRTEVPARLLGRPMYLGCPEHCGRVGETGLLADQPRFVDYSTLPTTDDQLRMESAFEGLEWRGRDALHVGVGNSSFATRFAPGMGRVVGLTISAAEVAHAESLGLPNYRVHLVSKYSWEMRPLLGQSFDFILDNNPNSFACCKFHFHQMVESYCAALKPGGVLLTDQGGMNWVAGDRRWRFKFEDLQWLERLFPVRAVRMTQSVYGLVRTGAVGVTLALDRYAALCSMLESA